MIIIASKYLVPKGYAAIAVYPFIILRECRLKQQIKLLNHERIHLRQQAELLIIAFYILYAVEYLVRLLMYRSHTKAYRNISFEREAYTNEGDGNYLLSRRFWNFTKYY